MSVLPVWIPGSVRNEIRFANPPGSCDISLEPSWQNKLIQEKKPRFARTIRPQCAKTCYPQYISCLKMTVYSFRPLE